METAIRVAPPAPQRKILLWVAIAVVIVGLILGKILWP